MIDFVHIKLFLQNSIPKKFFIISDTATITNTELHQEKFSVKESLCSDSNLTFGSCEASEIEFTVSNVFTPQVNKELVVKIVLNGDSNNPLLLGTYRVYSDKPTANRKDRVIKAYDAMHDIINADVTDWFNSILPNANSSVTVRQFRDSFISHFSLEQEEITLINDDVILTRTIDPETLSGKDVITKLCEMNGCFGHIGRDGKFKYIYLEPICEGLYPANDLYPDNELYPREPNAFSFTSSNCISANAEDYIVEKITRIQIRQEENDIGAVVGNEGNDFIIQDNFLLYGKSASELNTIAQRILDKVGGIYYRPFNAKVKGNPCLEVGDGIAIGTKYMIIQSYILQRTLTGIQSLRDSFIAEGQPKREERVNGSNSEIQQIKGRYSKLSKTVDETRLEMGDMEKDLLSTISVTAGDLRTEFTNTANGLQSQINQNAYSIGLKVGSAEFNAEINVLEREISNKVSSGDVVNEINISDKAITLKGNRLIVESSNFKLSSTGNVEITGYVNATSGFIGGFELSADGFLISGETILSNHTSYFGAVYTDDINGYKPITEGNIWNYIPSTSDFVTDYELSTALGAFVPTSTLNSTLQNYPTYSALNTVLDQKGYLTSSDLSGYATSNDLSALETDINNKLNGLDSGLTYVTTRISEISSDVSVHSGYISSFASEIGSLKARVAALESAI